MNNLNQSAQGVAVNRMPDGPPMTEGMLQDISALYSSLDKAIQNFEASIARLGGDAVLTSAEVPSEHPHGSLASIRASIAQCNAMADLLHRQAASLARL